MNNLDIYNKFRSVPLEAQKAIGAGRLKGMTDINPMWRIKMLTEQFGPCGIGWKISIVDKWLEQGALGVVTANVIVNLHIKVDGEWSEPIQGVGGASFIANEKSGLYTSDECFKMAYTDAISIACKMLGMAADIYYSKDRTKYDQQEDAAMQKPAIFDDSIKTRLAAAQSREDLAVIWNGYPTLHNNKEFRDSFTQRGQEIKANSTNVA